MIRPFSQQDLSPLLQIWRAASEIGHPFLTPAFLRQEEILIKSQYLPHSETWVYVKDEIVIGFISLLETEVGALFVHPDYHGQGVGTALMQHARSIRPFLEVEVFHENWLGRRFYKKFGFNQIGEYVHVETGQLMLRLKLQK